MTVYDDKARRLGVTIEKSKRKGKKFDVYRGKEFQASIGAKGYDSYEKLLRREGAEVANAKRRAYKARHVHRTTKYRDGKLTAAFLADRILW